MARLPLLLGFISGLSASLFFRILEESLTLSGLGYK